uniref:Uncharacterized protein n=1 Tax=Arundo donax TaxID=35708 RepID=A0A0A9FZY6_ARUDO
MSSSSAPATMPSPSPREHVERIRRERYFIGRGEQNPLAEDMHQAVNYLSQELYSKDVHFLMELVQVQSCCLRMDLLPFFLLHYRIPSLVLILESCCSYVNEDFTSVQASTSLQVLRFAKVWLLIGPTCRFFFSSEYVHSLIVSCYFYYSMCLNRLT